MQPAGPLDRAQFAFESGRYEEARDLLLQVLAGQPTDAAALRSLGIVSTRLGQPARAFRYLQQAVDSISQLVAAFYWFDVDVRSAARNGIVEDSVHDAARVASGTSERS